MQPMVRERGCPRSGNDANLGGDKQQDTQEFFFEEPETSLRTSTNVTIKQNEKQPLPPMICHFEVLMLTPIVKRKVLITEIFGFIKNHNSYAFVKFFISK